jgi:hypothetical protein
MVMSSTKAVATIIQAVSPESIMGETLEAIPPAISLAPPVNKRRIKNIVVYLRYFFMGFLIYG